MLETLTAWSEAAQSVIFLPMGHVGAAHRTVYCMTKHAVEGLTKAMAINLRRIGSGQQLGPTLVDTPLARRIVDTPEKRAYFESRIPGAFASIEDIMRRPSIRIAGSGHGDGRASSRRRRLDAQ